jgi:hypothetical protein
MQPGAVQRAADDLLTEGAQRTKIGYPAHRPASGRAAVAESLHDVIVGDGLAELERVPRQRSAIA